MKFTTTALIIASLGLASCTGIIAGDSSSETGASGDRGPADPEKGPPEVSETAPELVTTQLRRLTRTQYFATVRQLFGIEVDVTKLPIDATPGGFSNRGGSEVTSSHADVAQYEAVARDVAQQVFAADDWEAFVGCAPSAADDACATGFLEKTMRRVWRRAVEADELARYQAVAVTAADDLGGVRQGLESALAALLHSPYFVYRVEETISDSASPVGLRYGEHTLASRLSYLFTDSTPDDELLDAADAAKLSDPEELRRQAARLGLQPSARAALARFYREWLMLERLDALAKDALTFPSYTPELGKSMQRELELMFEELAFEPGRSFMELFDSKTAHVDADLAALYGLPAPEGAGFVKVSHPAQSQRAGLLTTAGFLAMNARSTMTSPTLRGIFIRSELMCEEIAPPPPDVVAELPESPDGVETQRQRLDRHRADPACAGCHELMDPLGLALENFDALGVHRATDSGLPIDARGTLDGVPFDGPVELAALLRAEERVAGCVARRFGEHALGRALSEPAAESLKQAFERGGHAFSALVDAVITSEAFRVPVK